MAGEQPAEGKTLRRVIVRAVTRSRPVARAIARRTHELVSSLQQVSAPQTDGRVDPIALDLVAQGDRIVDDVVEELTGLVDRQLQSIDRFNIVLFGRTSTGKSSLIESLTSGDGATISRGEVDHTRTVRRVEWESCTLYDTPGIEGWRGRRLTEESRQAVARADLVLLCFDNTNQQIGEFRKVAEWVRTYEKPVIAVLNVKSELWRRPTRVPRLASRRKLSMTQREHARHIREELARIRLPDVTVVAIHALRAFCARSGLSPPGHDPDLAARLQEEAGGADQLLDWSNLPLLERLVITAIETDAVGIRLGVLPRLLHGALADADEKLRAVEQAAVDLSAPPERAIERVLAMLGEAYAKDRAEDNAAVRSALHDLETERGEPFSAPRAGSVELHADNVISTRLAPATEAARRRAEVVVDEAVLKRREVKPEEFARRVFDAAEVKGAIEKIGEDLSAYLTQKLGPVTRTMASDLSTTAAGVTLPASQGSGWQKVGLTTSAAGIGLGAFVALDLAVVIELSAVTVIIFPPAFLVASVVAGGLGVLMRRRGTRKREEALAQARAAARGAVETYFQRVAEQVKAGFTTESRRVLFEHVAPAVSTALVCRRLASATAARRRLLQAADREYRAPADPVQILRRATTRCESTSAPGGDRLWLGESWSEEGTGADGAAVAPPPPADPSLGQAVRARLARLALGVTELPRPGSGREWLETLDRRLGEDPDNPQVGAARLLEELRGVAAEGRPRLVVCGDYDVGKSSFIRRLLVDDGQTVPPELVVKPTPSTDAVHDYPWKGLVLKDTPGLQSGRHDPTQVHQAVWHAGVVVYLFNPAFGRATGDLDLILCGDLDRGRVPKIDRTLFVIHRIDDAFDPIDRPREFLAFCDAKEGELERLLGALPCVKQTSRGVSRDHILCLISDPFGLVADDREVTREGFDAHRSFDGMDDFAAAIERLVPLWATNGADVAILHGGLARLGVLVGDGATEADRLQAQAGQLELLRSDLSTRLDEGRALADAQRRGLQSTVEGFLLGRLHRALSGRDPDRRKVILDSLASGRWTSDPELAQQVEDWASACSRQIAEWRRTTEDVLDQRLRSRAFRRAFPSVEPLPEAPVLTRRRGRAVRGNAGWIVRRVGAWASGLTGQGRAVRFLVRAGPVLQRAGPVLGGVLEAWMLKEEVEAERRAIGELDAWTRQLCEGGRRWAEHGAAAALGDVATAQLGEQAAAIDADHARVVQALDQVRRRLGVYREAMADALERLGLVEGAAG